MLIKHWIKSTMRDISDDLKTDDYISTGLDEIL